MYSSLRKQPTFGDATTGFPAKWRLRNERRKSILMTRLYPHLSSASDWLNQISHAARPIRGNTKIGVVTRHQYGISALVSKTSFGGKTSGSVAKCRQFAQANVQYLRGFLSMHTCWKICCRKDGGVSCTTCCTRSRVFKYSINLLIKFTKCPACLIFPGTASSKISSGKTGLDNTVSVSLAALASRNPWTSLLYSSLNLLASLSLILTEKKHILRS